MNEGFVGDMSFMPFSPGLRERRAAFHLEAPIVSSYGIATEPEVTLPRTRDSPRRVGTRLGCAYLNPSGRGGSCAPRRTAGRFLVGSEIRTSRSCTAPWLPAFRACEDRRLRLPVANPPLAVHA